MPRRVNWTTSPELLEYIGEWKELCNKHRFPITQSDLISILVMNGLNQLNHMADELINEEKITDSIRIDYEEYKNNYGE